ncbi:hypothetical protein [Catenulispora rubra]|uniref:hypothetical protein n=1 Tax=Catenulispora rubra TaxID=280293 RepID=UPI0018927FB5|nr:hypothetical protein [Catenulispora rubra]
MFANTGGRQRNLWGTTELRPLRGHPTIGEAVKIACKTPDRPHTQQRVGTKQKSDALFMPATVVMQAECDDAFRGRSGVSRH